jgi:serine/threonine protein kinase/formylglycine-generating enzyme required for sulfatase activity
MKMLQNPAQAAPTAWIPPREFDGYRLLWTLSRGRRGTVYLGHDSVLDRPVTAYFIDALDEPAREQMLGEARAAAKLLHPNLVTVYRVGEVDGRLYLIAEYVRGQALSALARPVPPRQVLDIALNLASALALAHRRGVLHRGVRPRNIIVPATGTGEGEVKLLNLGLAGLLDAAELDPPTDPPLATAAAAALGERDAAADLRTSTVSLAQRFGITPPRDVELLAPVRLLTAPSQAAPRPPEAVTTFLAPEVQSGEPATMRSDVYSLGAVLYDLLTAKAPAEGGDEAISVSKVAPLADPRLAAIIARCLRRDPAERFASAEELYAALEQLRPGSASEQLPEGNPYRGLLPFEAEHRALFFGRRSEIGTLVERLRTEACVLLAAESGVGKSSLCRAGVLPLVSEGALGGGRIYKIAVLVPGSRPLAALAGALATTLRINEAEISDLLRSDPAGFGRGLHQLMVRTQGERGGLLIFIDQMEELVTLAPPEEARVVGEALGSLLAKLPGLRLLLTARSDFLGRIATVPGIGEAVTRTLYILRPLGAEKIREAIVGPAHAKGVLFESQALVTSLVESTANTDGALPLLQFTLAELWEARDGKCITATALKAIGGVTGALARHADHVLGGLPDAQREAARRILLALVTLEGTRARRTEAEVAGGEPAARVALETLVKGRLLVARDTPEGAAYEVAHEALIKGWDTLRRWLEEYAESRAARQRLEVAAAEWRRLGRVKEALWGARQLAEAAILDAVDIGPREAEFLAASRNRAQRRRHLRNAAFLALPLALLSLYGAVQYIAHQELRRRVAAYLQQGAQQLGEARRRNAEIEQLRRDAFTAFDSYHQIDGEALWQQVLTDSQDSDRAYGRASQTFEAALTADSSSVEARAMLADSLFERALGAERDYHTSQLEDLLQRLALYDKSGDRRRRWSAPGRLQLTSTPAGAQVSVVRFERDPHGRMLTGPARALGATPIAGIELPPASYLFTFQLPAHAEVRYPLLIARASENSISVPLPPAAAIPEGFVFIPPGAFQFGTAGDEALRKTFLSTVPIHEVELGGYLIARTETTYGQWLEYLNALPPAERARVNAKVGKGSLSGAVELSELPGESWQLMLQPASQAFTARAGQKIIYSSRKVRREQDWLRMPVGGVTFDEAQAYAAWLAHTGKLPGARLCDEMEWERAARGADSREWAHGDNLLPTDANYDETYGKDLQAMGPDEVGSYPASRSPFGVDDLIGNVFEWTISRLNKGEPVVRSGGYFFSAIAQRSTNRNPFDRTFRDPGVGIRICASWPIASAP